MGSRYKLPGFGRPASGNRGNPQAHQQPQQVQQLPLQASTPSQNRQNGQGPAGGSAGGSQIEQHGRLQPDVQANKCGVGMMLAFDAKAREFVVTALARGGEAAKSGAIQVGDAIVKIDSQPLLGLSPDQVVGLVTGPLGSRVELVVKAQDCTTVQTAPFQELPFDHQRDKKAKQKSGLAKRAVELTSWHDPAKSNKVYGAGQVMHS